MKGYYRLSTMIEILEDTLYEVSNVDSYVWMMNLDTAFKMIRIHEGAPWIEPGGGAERTVLGIKVEYAPKSMLGFPIIINHDMDDADIFFVSKDEVPERSTIQFGT